MSDAPQKFMSILAKLVQPDNAQEAADALNAMLPMLSDLPERAWGSRECLNRVATAKRRTIVPSYADVRSAIDGWEREQPKPPVVGETARLDENGRRWFNYFRTREAENFGSVGGRPASSRAHVLSLVKQQSPEAWAEITGEPLTRRQPPTPEEAAIVRQAMERHEQARTAAQPPPKPTARKGYLQPAALAAARAAAGIKLPPPSEKLLKSLEKNTMRDDEDSDQPTPAPWIEPEPTPWEDTTPDDDEDDVPFPDEDDVPTRQPERALT